MASKWKHTKTCSLKPENGLVNQQNYSQCEFHQLHKENELNKSVHFIWIWRWHTRYKLPMYMEFGSEYDVSIALEAYHIPIPNPLVHFLLIISDACIDRVLSKADFAIKPTESWTIIRMCLHMCIHGLDWPPPDNNNVHQFPILFTIYHCVMGVCSRNVGKFSTKYTRQMD